jgi:hypothetical protein
MPWSALPEIFVTKKEEKAVKGFNLSLYGANK